MQLPVVEGISAVNDQSEPGPRELPAVEGIGHSTTRVL
jgi:hypothetical protein